MKEIVKVNTYTGDATLVCQGSETLIDRLVVFLNRYAPYGYTYKVQYEHTRIPKRCVYGQFEDCIPFIVTASIVDNYTCTEYKVSGVDDMLFNFSMECEITGGRSCVQGKVVYHVWAKNEAEAIRKTEEHIMWEGID